MIKKVFKKINKRVFLILIAIISILSVATTTIKNSIDFEIAKNLEIYYSVFKELSIYYVDEVEPSKLIKKSIDKMLEDLDPYTVYMPESQIDEYRLMTTGQYGGIGALIKKKDNYTTITDPYKGFPAEESGLKAGDIILEINGKSIKNKSLSDVSELLKGQAGTKLKLLIKRKFANTEKQEFELTRKEIKIKSVPIYKFIDDGVAYIKLTSFTNTASQEIKDAILELEKQKKIKALVLDLRSNPGGLLGEAVNVCNLFMPSNKIISKTKGKIPQWNKTFKTRNNAILPNVKLIVLVNSMSASASEIVSGAVQDYDRGVVLGQRTYGKGLVQNVRDVAYNGKLKITTAKYYIPSGRCIQAIDYSHRNEDGSVGKVPDSLISEFKTEGGRIVYDGGGIMPDIKTEMEMYSKITSSLFIKDFIFDFATKLYYENKNVENINEVIKISENKYPEFLKFIENKDFDYETESELYLSELVKLSKKEKTYDKAEKEFAALKNKIKHDKERDLINFKDEIIELISKELAGRFFYQKGKIEASLLSDEDIKKALEIIKNEEKYKEILD